MRICNGLRRIEPCCKWLSNWVPPILWTLQIFYLSSLPRSSYPKTNAEHFDTGSLQYLYHFGQFFCLAFLVYRAILHSSLFGDKVENHRKLIYATLLVIAIIALLDELIQIPVPTRKFTFRDLAADLVGGIFALLLIKIRSRNK